MIRYEVESADRHIFYLVESKHNRGILLSNERKAEYDKAVAVFWEWQKFLMNKE